ncbi:flagellar FliJ family protein [uncultured Microbacterium sp.]|uniref:flagellar FliJ family protein n=1 Tax=uncultured Microbacterium sp. TaxID=191216 RepID=UPI00261A82D4|nr:flagellar FliJ family protein [uncultured Microbacterium sp.]
MNRSFSLSGLLRVRAIQERQAAQELSRAVIDADQTRVRDRRLRAALGASGSDAVDARSLAALAAARVAGRSMLAELESLAALQQQAVQEARSVHDDARREVRGLDRLAEAHALRVRADELRVEQHELDEIASRSGTEDPA